MRASLLGNITAPASRVVLRARSCILPRSRLLGDEGRGLADLEQLSRVERAEEVDQLRHHSRPARLVTGAQPRPVVPVEIFVEQD